MREVITKIHRSGEWKNDMRLLVCSNATDAFPYSSVLQNTGIRKILQKGYLWGILRQGFTATI
ncbi:MAG: hypothetical protein UY44_C0007G0018 [Candidatus Kaiserbacteria bacterium GW2011_GWA2_49_19]|uniref:Uncharacterized protein n=2 Tax=Candidatus Kaiseribacteriota TaxID=1752734 RepID=A0A0G1VQN5_9BACT|nr:MAG: hypothetical protein UY44_C0007G0018 [Candidatus Kaiserbacteria bacterium GW2011_GWA2_49_19]OGG60426.1 MAG: hypothetical protein A3C86_02940 [Candidatus Kaiserbacteria bacterium RIFCSPHIGHO2_02_FULL_49_16]